METPRVPHWADEVWVGFDTETTGVSPHRDRIVTAAVVTHSAAASPQARSWLVDPQVEIPVGATRIHGISTRHARTHGRAPADALEEICSALAEHLNHGRPVVVFNARFDLRLLEAEARRHNVPTLESRLGGELFGIIDPLVVDRAVDRYRSGKRTLSDLAGVYEVPIPAGTHTADVDANLTLSVFRAMLRRHTHLQEHDLDSLFQFQAAQHALWAEDFEKFLASKGTNRRISRRWP